MNDPLPDPSQAARREALAQVAGGVAHDLNDLLTVINGHVLRLLDAEDIAGASVPALNQIYHAGDRAARLVRQLLIFSGQLELRAQDLALNDLVTLAAEGLRRGLGASIRLELDLAPALPPVRADADLLEHVLGNLVANAREAMPAGGRLMIKTEAQTAAPDGPAGASDSGTPAGVCLHVSDTGGGIAPDHLPRIFEPFFSTKAPGRNPGLGLATAQGILRQHGGSLSVASIVGAGSTFTAWLPASPPGGVTASAPAPASVTDRKRATLLLVEDDPLVRELTVAVLQDEGYRVLQAESGTNALEVWKWHAPRIELLLTDLLLQDDMTGLELATRLRAEKPGLKLICISGYGRETATPALTLPAGCKFLRKPCRPRVLTDAVRTLLEPKFRR